MDNSTGTIIFKIQEVSCEDICNNGNNHTCDASGSGIFNGVCVDVSYGIECDVGSCVSGGVCDSQDQVNTDCYGNGQYCTCIDDNGGSFQACWTNDNCPGQEPCIDGHCEIDGCDTSSSYDGTNCIENAPDTETYFLDIDEAGICARDNGGTYSCETDGAAYDGSNYYITCEEIESGPPTEIYSCDNDVEPDFVAEGMCAYDGSSTTECDVDGETCYNDTHYMNDCGACMFSAISCSVIGFLNFFISSINLL
jgi:hypothetical protein